MMERRQIVAAAKHNESDARVLVTLVHVEGSSYRQPGARLLTAGAASQAYAGTISGGCLEAEVVRKAAWKVRNGPIVDRYSTLYDDTAEIPFGLGCGGTVALLHEAAGTPEYNALMRALNASLHGESYTVITWLPGGERKFARAILAADGGVEFASEGLAPIAITSALVTGSRWSEDAGGVYIERLEPPQRLVVFGAGDDAKPLARMAALLGWSVLVVDGRTQLARHERFPEAQRVVVASSYNAASFGVSVSDAVILMTHSYEQDREWLAALLPIAPRYLGVLGAKHRSSLLVSEAAAMCGLPLDVCCDRIFAPVGLDLGGDGPEAIALAVISEAHARCMGKLGKSLRLSAADVAAQVRQGSKSLYQQAQCAVAANRAPEKQVNCVAAVVLAAGASKRLGEAKQNVRLSAEDAGETLLERTVRIANMAALEPVFVVTAPGHDYWLEPSTIILVNEDAAEGMASSIRTGIAAAMRSGVSGAVILACDQPSITEAHLRALAGSGDEIVASAYAGRNGVPAYFPRSAFAELMELRGDVGARELLRDARAMLLNKGELDIDTAEDLKRARELYTSDPPL